MGVPAGTQQKIRIFGAHKRAEALLAENSDLTRENERLRLRVTALMGMSVEQLAAEADAARAQVQADIDQAHAELATAQRQVSEARAGRDKAMAEATAAALELQDIRAQIVATDELAALQEVGIYEYRHPLQDAVAYKSRLAKGRTS